MMTDDMRRRAWPRLMKMEQVESAPKPPLEVVKDHKEYQQVSISIGITKQDIFADRR